MAHNGNYLERAMATTDFIHRRVKWSDWYARSHVRTLVATMDRLLAQGHTRASIEDLAAGSPRPWSEAAARRARKGLQRTVYGLVQRHAQPDPAIRMRGKLARL